MARKNVLQYEVSTAQSMATSFTSPVTLIKYLDNCSYQINITTSNSTGTFAVEVSDDYKIDEANGQVVLNAGHWAALTLNGGTPSAAAANDTIVIDLNQLPFNAMRISYTSTIAGTGTCDIWLSCKQLAG